MSDMTRRKAVGGLARQLRPSRLLIGVSAAAVAAAVLAASGSAASRPSLARPSGLQTFIKRLDEPRRLAAPDVPEYSRTPSFAWSPVRGATRYEFQLSTSDGFRADNGLVWSSKTLLTPATTIPLSLPWITGDPASLYWRVRAVNGGSVSPWSAAQPFSMRWSSVPTEWRPDSGSPADMPGYVRWHPVDGATGYQVWFVNAGKVISTITNVADEREYYTFNKGWTGDVKWRVRAVRSVYGKTSNKLPVVSYGPWSPEYTWTNTTDPLASGTDVQPVAAVSDRASTPDRPDVHSLMPAFLFAGNGDAPQGLHRAYIFSDSDCVNAVHRGSVVGGPAYAPRISGPLALPQSVEDLGKARGTILKDGAQADTFALDGAAVTTSEAVGDASGSAPAGSTGDKSASSDASAASGAAKVDLWDRNWQLGGRYYYAVVPVRAVMDDDKLVYRDTELPQDVCQGSLGADGTQTAPKRVLAFGKNSADAMPIAQAIGLSPAGRLLMDEPSRTSFYGAPLVTWDAAPAASAYDVEWSRRPNRWHAAGHIRTPATSALLPVSGGTWWYRVRGINPSLPGDQRMTWSRKVRIRIAKPTYRVVGR
jgi:hypothetical protein